MERGRVDLKNWAQLLDVLAKLPALATQVAAHETKITRLDRHMATAENTLAALDAVTNALADDAAALATKLQALQDAVTSGNTAAVNAAMESLSPDIARLQATESTLRGLGADPANPVPTDAPA